MHSLALIEQGTAIHAKGDTLAIHRGKSVIRTIPVAQLDQLLLLGRIELTSGAIALLLRRGVDVAWLTLNGRFRGRLLGRATKHVALRLAQYRRATDRAFCLAFSSTVIAAKIHQQRQVLLRAQRKLRDPDLAESVGRLRLLKQRATEAGSLESLRGIEGAAAATYFSRFGLLLKNEQFHFNGRSRRPPRDEVNSMLSFGYAVLGSSIETELYRCGIDPLLGFFHQPVYGRASLMLDLLEQWRPTLDTLVLRLINRRQLGTGDFERRTNCDLDEILNDDTASLKTRSPNGTPNDQDLTPPWEDSRADMNENANGDVTDGSLTDQPVTDPHKELDIGVYLGDMGRRVFLNQYFRRLRERMYYAPRQASFELRDIIREQIYHLSRVLEGEDVSYVPFVPE